MSFHRSNYLFSAVLLGCVVVLPVAAAFAGSPATAAAAVIALCLALLSPPLKPDQSSGEDSAPHGLKLMLLISVAGLYIELVLIRWIGTEVRIFAYVQNLALIACFLGFGVGCFDSGKPGSLLPVVEKLALLTLIVYVPLKPWQDFMISLSNLLTLSPDAALWGLHYRIAYAPALQPLAFAAAVAVVAGLLWLIASAMIPLGRWIGFCFDQSRNVTRAYSVNLAGSLIGTWLLVGLSWLSLPPSVWLGVAIVLLLLATPKSLPNWAKGCALLVPIVIIIQASSAGTLWSPYQKLTFSPLNKEGEYIVNVNNTGYMTIYNTTAPFLEKHPDIEKHYRDTSYDSPFRFLAPNPSVLIVGAGAGNDASAALRNGAAHVDAVEIDPVIYGLGRQWHPDRPYDSPRVNVIVNDARNFLRTSDRRYDAVIFGLLDSHTVVSGYSNMRVDNYVYTKEAFEQARRLLKPDGVLVLKFQVRAPWTWIGQRFYRTLTDVFGHEPVAYEPPSVGNMWNGTVFLDSAGTQLWKKAARPELGKFIATHPVSFDRAGAAPEASTDDWPYPYHRERAVPETYLMVSALLLLIAFFMVRRSFLPSEKDTWKMFTLGAGFMLMETQLISRLSLYFGTTWVVNSIAVSTVLAVLVLANAYLESGKRPDRRKVCYAVLVSSLLANYFIPWESLPLSSWTVGLLLSAAYAVPVLMAGIIFTTTLQKAEKTSGALGANVLGAVFGGLSQNLSFILGLKALLPVAAFYYLLSALFGRKA